MKFDFMDLSIRQEHKQSALEYAYGRRNKWHKIRDIKTIELILTLIGFINFLKKENKL